MANKRGTKYFSKPGEDSFLKSENYFLRKKNEDLAKALSETKIEHQKLIQNSLQLHERLYATDVQRIKYKEFINTFSLDMQMYIQQFISMTEQMTNMLNKVNTVIRSPEALDRLIINNNTSQSLKTPSNQNSKTMMAVMPMISGHTILSPKVNLPRVSVRQLVDMAESSHGDEAASSHEIAPDEVEFPDNVDVSPNDEYLLENDSETANEPQNNRLETMQEENEDEEGQSDISSQALLSGVFKDVKVYISPLANQHVIQFKSGTSRRLDSKAFNKSNHSLSARNSLLNSSGSRTLTQSSNDSSRSIDSDANESNVVQAKHERTDQTQGISSCSRTAVDEYDPMEGPSNAVNSIREIAEYFRPCPNETSTPYLPESKAEKLNNSSTLDGTTTPIPKNVTRRRGNSRRTRTLSSKLSNCSVILNKLSPKTLKTYNWESESSPTRDNTANVKERHDSPTVLERSRRSSAQLTKSNRKRSNSDTSYYSGDSPKSQRVRRNVKPIAYKEQSLRKKLRR